MESGYDSSIQKNGWDEYLWDYETKKFQKSTGRRLMSTRL